MTQCCLLVAGRSVEMNQKGEMEMPMFFIIIVDWIFVWMCVCRMALDAVKACCWWCCCCCCVLFKPEKFTSHVSKEACLTSVVSGSKCGVEFTHHVLESCVKNTWKKTWWCCVCVCVCVSQVITGTRHLSTLPHPTCTSPRSKGRRVLTFPFTSRPLPPMAFFWRTWATPTSSGWNWNVSAIPSSLPPPHPSLHPLLSSPSPSLSRSSTLFSLPSLSPLSLSPSCAPWISRFSSYCSVMISITGGSAEPTVPRAASPSH